MTKQDTVTQGKIPPIEAGKENTRGGIESQGHTKVKDTTTHTIRSFKKH